MTMDATAKLSHICPQQNNEQTESTGPTDHDIFSVVQDEDNRESFRIVQLDLEGGEVTSLGKIPYLFWPSVVVFCDGSIFCLGDENCSGLVHEFDLVKRTARTPTRLVNAVQCTASAAFGHKVIVSGGADEIWNAVTTCSVYTPATNRWTSLRQLRQARMAHQMCWLPDGRVFALGGYFNGCLSSVEMLERVWIPAPRVEASAEWQCVTPMKTGRQGFGCCVVEDRIVVAGGYTSNGKSSSVESFEPPTATNIGQWTSLTDLASAVGRCFLVASSDRLVVLDWYEDEMKLGRWKAQMASSDWTWEPFPRLASFGLCWGLVSLPLTAGASQR